MLSQAGLAYVGKLAGGWAHLMNICRAIARSILGPLILHVDMNGAKTLVLAARIGMTWHISSVLHRSSFHTRCSLLTTRASYLQTLPELAGRSFNHMVFIDR